MQDFRFWARAKFFWLRGKRQVKRIVCVLDAEDLIWSWSGDKQKVVFWFFITSALGILLDFEGWREELEACTGGGLWAAIFWALTIALVWTTIQDSPKQVQIGSASEKKAFIKGSLDLLVTNFLGNLKVVVLLTDYWDKTRAWEVMLLEFIMLPNLQLSELRAAIGDLWIFMYRLQGQIAWISTRSVSGSRRLYRELNQLI